MSYFTNDQAIDVWKAKWRGEGPQAIVERYRKSPFRVYEVWMESRNLGTRLIAFEQLKKEAPELAGRIDPSPHVPKRKVISRSSEPSDDQGSLF